MAQWLSSVQLQEEHPWLSGCRVCSYTHGSVVIECITTVHEEHPFHDDALYKSTFYLLTYLPMAVLSGCCCSENVPRARKELTNLSRYTSARRKLHCLRRVVNCLVTHSMSGVSSSFSDNDEHSAGLTLEYFINFNSVSINFVRLIPTCSSRLLNLLHHAI